MSQGSPLLGVWEGGGAGAGHQIAMSLTISVALLVLLGLAVPCTYAYGLHKFPGALPGSTTHKNRNRSEGKQKRVRRRSSARIRSRRRRSEDEECDEYRLYETEAKREANNRYYVFSTLAWVVWATSFVGGLAVVYHYLSAHPHILLANLGAAFVCSLFAEVFMISAFVAFANPAARGIASETRAKCGEDSASGGARDGADSTTTSSSAAAAPVPYLVIILGTCLSVLGGCLVSLIEFLPNQNLKLVYTALSGACILIGVTKTHGLGGWVMHRTRRRAGVGRRRAAAQHPAGGDDGSASTARPKEASSSSSSVITDQFDSNWSFWQPKRGGTVFIVTQVFGWFFFATSLLLLAWVGKFAVRAVKTHRSLALPTAAVMIAAQLVIAGSLTFFKDAQGDPKGQGALGASWKLRLDLASEASTMFLFYCPHYIIISALLIPYLVLPVSWASSIMMGVHLPLYLLGSLGQPQTSGAREYPAFRSWVAESFVKIHDRFLGGVSCTIEGRRSARRGGRKLVFAYHPHALYPLGVVVFHLLPAFRDAFPAVDPVTLVASVIFRLPFMSDMALWAGCREVTATTFRRALRERGSVALVPGGQAEICVAPRAHHPTRPELVLNTRHKGFVKIALEQQADLVPVLCFGEIYQLRNGISLPRLQAWTYRKFGFPVPFLPVGRFFVPLPLPREGGRALHFVVGEPLRVPEIAEGEAITRELVEATHAEYYARVADLYHRHKDAAGYGNVQLKLES